MLWLLVVGLVDVIVVKQCQDSQVLMDLLTSYWMEGALQSSYWGGSVASLDRGLDCLAGLWQVFWTPKITRDPLNLTKSSPVAGLLEMLSGSENMIG